MLKEHFCWDLLQHIRYIITLLLFLNRTGRTDNVCVRNMDGEEDIHYYKQNNFSTRRSSLTYKQFSMKLLLLIDIRFFFLLSILQNHKDLIPERLLYFWSFSSHFLPQKFLAFLNLSHIATTIITYLIRFLNRALSPVNAL